MDGIGFGAAYYAEYQRHPDLRADFDLMARAGNAWRRPAALTASGLKGGMH
jgi:hypothetical protein